ncbi:MAG: DUF4358 domain-containing protein [Oscillospiraceae bacterium]|nr:DUF4358 domain-containing protein [Oscillospiraceae bacterium]
MIKRLTAAVLCTAIAFAAFTGCAAKEEQTDIDLTKTADELQSQLVFKDNLNRLDDSMMSNFYPSVDLSKVSEYAVFVSGTGSTAEEIALFELKSSDDIQMIENAIDERLTDQKIAYQDYVPEEMVKIENAVVKTGGNYVFAVLCDDTDSASEILSGYFK